MTTWWYALVIFVAACGGSWLGATLAGARNRRLERKLNAESRADFHADIAAFQAAVDRGVGRAMDDRKWMLGDE